MTIKRSMMLHNIFTRIVRISCFVFLFYPVYSIYRSLTISSTTIYAPFFKIGFWIYSLLWVVSFFTLTSSEFNLNQDGWVRFDIKYGGSFQKSFPSRLMFLLLTWPLFLWYIL